MRYCARLDRDRIRRACHQHVGIGRRALHREHPRRVTAHDAPKQDARCARLVHKRCAKHAPSRIGELPMPSLSEPPGPWKYVTCAVLLHDVDAAPPDAVPEALARICLRPAVDALVDEAEVARLREELDELVGLRVDGRLIDRRSVFGARVRERQRLRVRRQRPVGGQLRLGVGSGVLRGGRRAARESYERKRDAEAAEHTERFARVPAAIKRKSRRGHRVRDDGTGG